MSLVHAITSGDDRLAISIIDDLQQDLIDEPCFGSCYTPLGAAVLHGRHRVADYLLRHKHASPSRTDLEGYGPIYWACQAGSLSMTKLLLDAGADVNTYDDPEHLFSEPRDDTPFAAAIRFGCPDLVQLLIRERADTLHRDEHGRTQLITASSLGHASIVELLLPFSDLETTDCYDRTALKEAAFHGHAEVLNLLIDAGAQIDSPPGQPGPLAFAVTAGFANAVSLLLDRGADPNLLIDRQKANCLIKASQLCRPSIIELLLPHTADVNGKLVDGRTALTIAAGRACTQSIEILLQAASPNVSGARGRTPLMIAALAGNEAGTAVLLKHAAIAVNKTDQLGFTALMYAAKRGHEVIVLQLLRRAADTSIATSNGVTALSLAKTHRWSSIETVLADDSSSGVQQSSDLSPSTLTDYERLIKFVYPAPSDDWTRPSAPYLGQMYSGDSFMTYPKTEGFDLSALKSGNESRLVRSAESWLKFLQSWLYFGLATEVLRIALDEYPKQKVSQDDPDAMDLADEHDQSLRRRCHAIDLRALIRNGLVRVGIPRWYWREWLRRASANLPLPERKRRAVAISEVLKHAWGTCKRVNELAHREGSIQSSDEWKSQFMFFSVEGAYLTNLAATALGREVVSHEGFWPEWQSTALVDSMVQDEGWCHDSARFVLSSMQVDTLLALCLYVRARGSCGEKGKGKCTAHHVQGGVQETQHVNRQCSCSVRGPNIAQLVKIVESGDQPMILLDQSDTEGDLSVAHTNTSGGSGQQASRYIAISHVWSDGLGNDKENKICDCQLRRITRLCRLADPEAVGFWLDTLCIPLEPGLRELAISKMITAYVPASATLVLDRGLLSEQAVSSESSNGTVQEQRSFAEYQLKLLLKFSACLWTRRLWTLQESMSSGNLFFGISGQVIHVERLLDSSSEHPTHFESSVWNDCRMIIGRVMYDMNQLMPISRNMIRSWEEESDLGQKTEFWNELDRITFNKRLVSILQGLAWRSTSKAEHVIPFLACALQVDPAEFTKGSAEERLSRLVAKIQGFPTTILFSNVSRLSTRGLRWFPSTILKSEAIMKIDANQHFTNVNETGMYIYTRTLLLTLEDPPSAPIWPLKYTDLRGENRRKPAEDLETFVVFVSALPLESEERDLHEVLRQLPPRGPLYLLFDPADDHYDASLSTHANTPMVQGLIVLKERNQGVIHFGQPLLAVKVVASGMAALAGNTKSRCRTARAWDSGEHHWWLG